MSLRRFMRIGADIYLKGVYLTSCLLCSKLRNFRTIQGDEAAVDVCGGMYYMLHAYLSVRLYRISAWASALLILV